MKKGLCLQFGFGLFLAICFWLLPATQASAALSASDVQYYFNLDNPTWSNGWYYEDYLATSSQTMATGASGSATTTGKFGLGLSFTNSGAPLAGTGSWTRKTTGEWAYSTWVKTTETGAYLNIFNINGGTSDNFLRLEIRNGTDINFTAQKSGGGWCDLTMYAVYPNDGAWHNIEIQGTWGSIETDFKLYVDGVEEQSGLSSGCNNAPNGTAETASYGKGYSSGAIDLQMDDLAFFNRKLTTDEITDLQTSSVGDLLAPQISGSLIWAGAGTQYAQAGGNWSVPFYFDLCADYNSIESAAIDVSIGGDFLQKWAIRNKTTFVGPQNCRGYITLTGPVSATTTQSGTATAYLEDDPVSGVVYATTSVPFTIGLSAYNTTNYIAAIDPSPIYIPPNQGTSTALRFSYDFTGLNWTGGEVCLYSLDAQAATAYCVPITTASGASQLTILNSTAVDEYIDGDLRLYDADGVNLLRSDPFMIVWYGVAASLSSKDAYNMSNHDLACSAAEWAEADTAVFFNMIRLKCHMAETWLNIVDAIAGAPKKAAQGTIESLKLMFPFSVPAKIYETWQDSATASIPSGLTWLDPGDSSGNVSITMPAALFGATSTIVVWGPDLASGSSGLQAVFAGIKALSPVLMAAAFFIGLYATGWWVYEKTHEAGQ